MIPKAILLLCAQAILAQRISSQCPLCPGCNGIIGDGRPFAVPRNAYIVEAPLASIAAGPYDASPLVAERPAFRPTDGGSFVITSVSPIAVTGITMKSENAYEGSIGVSGAIPFLGAVDLEGSVPTAGVGVVSYGCGNGNVAIMSEDMSVYPGPYGYATIPGVSGYGYGYSPMAYEAGIVGLRDRSGYGYNRGCGGALY